MDAGGHIHVKERKNVHVPRNVIESCGMIFNFSREWL